jgi:hypothetical protein
MYLYVVVDTRCIDIDIGPLVLVFYLCGGGGGVECEGKARRI